MQLQIQHTQLVMQCSPKSEKLTKTNTVQVRMTLHICFFFFHAIVNAKLKLSILLCFYTKLTLFLTCLSGEIEKL